MKNKYEVKTDLLKDFEQGSVIKEVDNGIQYAHEGAIPGDPAIPEDVIRRNPGWFEKIEPQWEVERIEASFGYMITNSELKIDRFLTMDESTGSAFTHQEAEAIATALNELDKA